MRQNVVSMVRGSAGLSDGASFVLPGTCRVIARSTYRAATLQAVRGERVVQVVRVVPLAEPAVQGARPAGPVGSVRPEPREARVRPAVVRTVADMRQEVLPSAPADPCRA